MSSLGLPQLVQYIAQEYYHEEVKAKGERTNKKSLHRSFGFPIVPPFWTFR